MKKLITKLSQREKNNIALTQLMEGEIHEEEFIESWKGMCYTPTVYSTVKNTILSIYYQFTDYKKIA